MGKRLGAQTLRIQSMNVIIRPAGLADAGDIAELLPELASFDVPKHRNPKDLWVGDLATLKRWVAGREPSCMVHVAEIAPKDTKTEDTPSTRGFVGFTIISLREELLSHDPSAHLEAIVVAEPARGAGVGRALLNNAETMAKAQGALSMTLHVFGNNTNARAVYRAHGYDEELIRASKLL